MKDNEMKNCLSKRYSKNNAMSKIFSDKQYIDRFSSLMKQKKKKRKTKKKKPEQKKIVLAYWMLPYSTILVHG